MSGKARGRLRSSCYGEAEQRSMAPDFAANYQVNLRDRTLGPVNTMSAYANGWHGVPIEAADDMQTGRLHLEGNGEWRLDLCYAPPLPFGLLPRVCGHSVNRP